ncbi:MAG TPA: transposase [Epulopiscium sp.]|nr:transposase [Candidatus Epulonipiscium sp.]
MDWAGSTLKVTDRSTGEDLTAYVFIATLPYSQYSYVEAFLDMKSANWLIAHIHALEYFGGATGMFFILVALFVRNTQTRLKIPPKKSNISCCASKKGSSLADLNT